MFMDEASRERLHAILRADTDSLTELTRIAGLDPAVAYRGADLSGADLRGEVLDGYDFTDALLDGAQCEGTDLSGTLGLERSVMERVSHDAATRWPEGFVAEPQPESTPPAP